MTQRPRKAIIIGAGIAGPVSAIFLKRAGIDAQVFEAWPHSTGIGGGLQIAPNGMHVLAEIGLADEMIRRGSIAEAFDFYSQSGSPARLDQQEYAAALRSARGEHVPRHAPRGDPGHGPARERRSNVRKAPGPTSKTGPISLSSPTSPTAPAPKAIF